MARVIAALIRHADYQQLQDAPSALQPFPLTAEGRRQAHEGGSLLREVLSEEGWTLHPQLDSSRLLRAWQTAEILTDELSASAEEKLRIESFAALAERSVGSVANLTLRQIESAIHADPRFSAPPADWKSNSYYCLPLQGAESLMQAGERVALHLEERILTVAQYCTVDTLKLFIGHGAAFRHAAYQLGLISFEQIAQLSMYHCQPVFIERLGERHWRHVRGDWKVRRGNERFTD